MKFFWSKERRSIGSILGCYFLEIEKQNFFFPFWKLLITYCRALILRVPSFMFHGHLRIYTVCAKTPTYPVRDLKILFDLCPFISWRHIPWIGARTSRISNLTMRPKMLWFHSSYFFKSTLQKNQWVSIICRGCLIIL